MPKKEDEIGALWKNKTKSGDTYLKGTIEFGDQKFKIAVFKNNYKQKESHPDYRVLLSGNPIDKAAAQIFSATDDGIKDDIPFGNDGLDF